MSVTSAECLHVPAGQGMFLNVIGHHQCVILTGEQTGGVMTLLTDRDPPGTGIPLHYHGQEDEVFHVLEGEVEFTIGDQKVLARQGDTIYGPRKIPHAFKAVGNRDARMLVWLMPGGLDRMFRELAELGKGGQQPDMGKAMEICGRYDVHFLPTV